MDAGHIEKKGSSFTHYSGSAITSNLGNTNSNLYYVFDLSSAAGTITNTTFDFTGGWQSGNPSLNLFQVKTYVNDLTNGNVNLRLTSEI